MTKPDLTKHYLLRDFDPATDTVLVLRRYNESTHPWGVHIITTDLSVPGLFRSRPVGLFHDADLLQLARKAALTSYFPFGQLIYAEDDFGAALPIERMVAERLERHVWTEVVPMEWHGLEQVMAVRVLGLSRCIDPIAVEEAMFGYGYGEPTPLGYLPEWMRWGWQRPQLVATDDAAGLAASA